ncbi:LPXTG-site transpeptidase (sortase) family protein [Thermocatellispora tengchongensis]|uniref:LPXTG-site transpeptidase (Sortase) family protein n=1 Tax=Thermocatellispora tengchongensis TaxID=1073253 RepID=A0A840PBC5_9ACTN|nr:class F sortase [Thermocatellispora tengchongensis]MBB5138704.1 LPXTG-site transpeptidase (sortase) family protein [Thermocatellispora tengchongensis]
MAHPGPKGGSAPEAKKGKGGIAAMPALLVVGSLGGIAAIMAGLLTYLSPASSEELYAVGDGPAGQDGTVNIQAAAQPMLLPSVGPGGPDVPLTPAEPAAPPPLPAVKVEPPVATTKSTRPTKISIPGIGVKAPLISVGVQKSGEIEVPPLERPKVAGWYRLGPVPGEIGPAVIVGHVNNKQGPAVFSRLREVKRGDKVRVARNDGKILEFTVDGVEQVSKGTFPTNRVYSNLNDASLRLITCGGVYNPAKHSYSDNIIVYATLSKKSK